MKIQKTLRCVILSSFVFILHCGDQPIKSAMQYEENLRPDITIGPVSGDYAYGYMKRTGSLTFTYAQDKAGYYAVRVYDASSSYISGTGLNAWISYDTPNQNITVTIYGPNSFSGHDTYFNGSGDFTVRLVARDVNSNETVETRAFSVAPLNAILVSGAGSTAVNGWYQRITSFTFMRPSTQYTVNYQKTDVTTYYISVDDMMPGSHVHSGGSSDYMEYYYSYSTSVPPATTGWSRNITNGVLPVPTFYINTP
jgi:hypothetical protein